MIDNMMDVIDSRDIIERIVELEELISDELTSVDILKWCDECYELKILEEQCKDYVEDWEYGATLIRYSHFTEYCRELLVDCGEFPKDLPWYIADHIDWEGVARDLSMDYTEVDFNGVTYFVR